MSIDKRIGLVDLDSQPVSLFIRLWRTMKKIKSSLIIILGLTLVFSCKKGPENTSTGTPANEKRWVVTTVAGDGTPDFKDGPALSSSFHFPVDVAVTPDGIIYVADILNHRIRKLADGQVTSFAGNDGFGIVNGNGSTAQFKYPLSLALNSDGSLFTSDENDPRIRKITSAADVSTYAGVETEGFFDGNADSARFKSGNSIASDALGIIYVVDALNNRIRKISTDGKVTTIAGSGEDGFTEGAALTAQFSYPGPIAVDKQGNLYVGDRGNFRIRKVTPDGQVSTYAGSGIPGLANGSAATAEFSEELRGIAIDRDGNLYVIDFDRIRKISPQGIVSTVAGSTAGFADGEAGSAKFNYPAGLTIDAGGSIYVADLNNNRIRKISLE